MFVISKKKSFTLAEVLITLALIGVVAAMSIPALIKNIEDAKYSSMAKNKVAQLNQIFKRVAMDNGGTVKGVFALHGTGTDDQCDYYAETLKPYFNYKTLCKLSATNIDGNCWHNDGNWYIFNGDLPVGVDSEFYRKNAGFLINDGSYVIISSAYYGHTQSPNIGTWIGHYNAATQYSCNDGGSFGGHKDGYLAMMVDLDGKAGPNRLGKDIHILFVNEHGNIITHENCTDNNIYGALRIRYYLYGFEEFK